MENVKPTQIAGTYGTPPLQSLEGHGAGIGKGEITPPDEVYESHPAPLTEANTPPRDNTRSIGTILFAHTRPDQLSPERISSLVETHLDDVLKEFPTIKSLPMPDMLSDLAVVTNACPAVIEEAVTVHALRKHLTTADDHTPEIGINIFPSGAQVMEVGTVDSIRSHTAWKFMQEHSVVDFHTHPSSPEDAEAMRRPSLGDLINAANLNMPILIGSRDGLSWVPIGPEVNHDPLYFIKKWEHYVRHERGFSEQAFDAYGANKVYGEFITDVVGVRFMSWDSLDPYSTLHSVRPLE